MIDVSEVFDIVDVCPGIGQESSHLSLILESLRFADSSRLRKKSGNGR